MWCLRIFGLSKRISVIHSVIKCFQSFILINTLNEILSRVQVVQVCCQHKPSCLLSMIMSQWRMMCLDGTSPFRVSKKQFLIVNSTEAIKHTSSVQLSCCPPGHPGKPSSWRDFLGLPVWRLLHHKILHLPLNSTTAFSGSHLCSPDINSAIPVVVPLNWRRSATILTTIHPHLWSVGHRENGQWYGGNMQTPPWTAQCHQGVQSH